VADGGITPAMMSALKELESYDAEVTIVEDSQMTSMAEITDRMGVIERAGIDAAPTCPELLANCAEADVIVVHVASVNREVIDAAPNLKLVCVLRGGYENADVEYLKSKGIRLTNAPWRSANAVADFTVGMMIGGLGIMTLASILGMAVSRHIGLTQRMLAASETHSRLGEVGSLVRAVVVVALSAQAVLFVSLIPFFLREGEALLSAFSHAAFMAISIFNNGGFVILSSGLAPHVGDWGLTIPIVLGTVVGAFGFPVLLGMWRGRVPPGRRREQCPQHLRQA